MGEETLYDRIHSLSKFDKLKERVGLDSNDGLDDYMYVVEWTNRQVGGISSKGLEGINGIIFYNTSDELTNMEFVKISQYGHCCDVIKRHYNVTKNQIIEHIERVLEITL